MITPQEALEFYRKASEGSTNSQPALFMQMTLDERMELTFYMLHHHGQLISELYKKITPSEDVERPQ